MKYIIIIVITVVLNIPIFLHDLSTNIKNETYESIIDKQETAQAQSSETNDESSNTYDSNEVSNNETNTSQTTSMDEEEQTMINLINKTRIENGLNQLTFDPNLYSIAKTRANEITELFSHNRPNGEPFYTISKIVDGENLARFCAGDASSTFNGFMNSKNHKENILYSSFKRVACFKLNDNDKVYWVQLFGC